MDDMNKKIEFLQGRLNELIEKYPSVPVEQYIKKGTDEVIEKFDPDSSPAAWKYFLKTYANLFTETEKNKLSTYNNPLSEDNGNTDAFWIQKLEAEYKRICGTFIYSKNLKLTLTTSKLDCGKNIGIAGDCCFNFKCDKKKKFISIINKDEITKTNKNTLIKILNLCYLMHYSQLNFALMPVNGGMNNIKGDGLLGLDRFDVFISTLNLYYKIKNDNPCAIKLIAEFEGSYNSLVPFLKSINTFDNYCSLFYPELLSDFAKERNLLNRLNELGKESINSTDHIIKYIMLAIDFWEAKANYYDKKTKTN